MKNGRPKKDKEQIKEIVKHIRYSAEEWASVRKKVESSGLNFSQFIRRATFNVTITPINMDLIVELRNIRTELVRIGKNINDIARRAATIDTSEDVALSVQDLRKCREMAMELSAELDKIRNAIR